GAITAAILAWLIVRHRCWRIGIVLLVLALLVGPVGKVIHEHARQVSFLQDCLLKAEHETIDYCAENYGVRLWAFDAVLILFMLLGACLIVVYVRTSRCQ